MWQVKGLMRFIFITDFVLMVANLAIAAIYVWWGYIKTCQSDSISGNIFAKKRKNSVRLLQRCAHELCG
jgi:hypothetical protein